MRTPYAFVVDVTLPLPAVVDALRGALAAEQMGIVSEIDVQATLKTRLGLDTPPHRLLGLCSPRITHALLAAEPDLGAMLPCGAGVREVASGHTRVALQDPRVIAAVTDDAAVRAACELAHAALRRALDRLAASTANPAEVEGA